jgi:FtsP/CotA-like multicopper oxidase with cupredoxin domain
MPEHLTTHTHFPTDAAGASEATPPETVQLSDGDRVELEIGPVAKRLGDTTVRMLAYNGSIPGPTLRVPQGATVDVTVVNRGDLEATVHWHGLRLENCYDGTHETQAPIPVGGSFTYRVHVPDAGAYWYHPHVREDYGQELGLYGNIIVAPADADYWPFAHREIAVTLDDVLLEDGRVAPFSREDTNYAAMGRFGNVMLIGGEPDLVLFALRGEVVRFYLTNTANTRVFRVGIPDARMKLVGGDSGRVEREIFVDDVTVAPSERVVVDVLFERGGVFELQHRTPDRTYSLGQIRVADEEVNPPVLERFAELRTNDEMAAERARIAPYLEAEPDKTLAFVAQMDMGGPESQGTYMCPMHPDVVSEEPGSCPKCGMKLLPAQVVAAASDRHEHEHHAHGQAGGGHEHHGHHGQSDAHEHGHATADGIEWEDDMVEVNRMTTPANMRWKIVDRSDGAENHAIDWKFQVGDRVKIRLVNEMDSDHPMHHPFHIHGAGRFLILARDGRPEPNLVWKDTVLVRTGETVDILLDVTNPGRWMAHCHIAEHHESGMMFSFDVKA